MNHTFAISIRLSEPEKGGRLKLRANERVKEPIAVSTLVYGHVGRLYLEAGGSGQPEVAGRFG